MFREGLYTATVKVHGRCCMWKGGKPFRRLDIDLNGGTEGRVSRRVETQVEAFMERIGQQLGVDLAHCWQAGAHRDWSWRGCLQQNWGWLVTCVQAGWQPTSAPDRHGHWIGYTPVSHLDRRGRVLPVDHDADVRHGFDEARGMAFCLSWHDGGNVGRLALKEVPMSAMEDGTYELVGPHDLHGGPYRDSLPIVSEDVAYPVRFPNWDNDRNERHYFIHHGSVQWSNNLPPNPLDQGELKQWMQTSGVEGVVWHGRDRFEGQMYKCHFGHLGLPKPAYRFTCQDQIFVPHTVVQSHGSNQVASSGESSGMQCSAVLSGICRCPSLASDIQQVILLRHGQSTAQKAPQKQRSADPRLLDAPLSSEGARQAASLSVMEQPDLVVVSPLTRALQTVRPLLTKLSGCRCVVHPCLQEFSGRNSGSSGWESVGRRLCDLQGDDGVDLTSIDVSLLGGPRHQWWVDCSEHPAPRVRTFLAWLHSRPERYILIVGHNNLFRELVKGGSGNKEALLEFENCVPVHCKVEANGLTLVRRAAALAALASGNCASTSGVVMLRLCRAVDQKDMKSINVPRAAGVAQVLQVAQNKWRMKKFRPKIAMLSDQKELTDELLLSLEDGTLVVCS